MPMKDRVVVNYRGSLTVPRPFVLGMLGAARASSCELPRVSHGPDPAGAPRNPFLIYSSGTRRLHGGAGGSVALVALQRTQLMRSAAASVALTPLPWLRGGF